MIDISLGYKHSQVLESLLRDLYATLIQHRLSLSEGFLLILTYYFHIGKEKMFFIFDS